MPLVIWCRHSGIVAILERELAFWKSQFQHERQRAEQAVDELLRVRVQVGPVTPPTGPTEAARRLDELLANPEFTQAGSAEGE